MRHRFIKISFKILAVFIGIACAPVLADSPKGGIVNRNIDRWTMGAARRADMDSALRRNSQLINALSSGKLKFGVTPEIARAAKTVGPPPPLPPSLSRLKHLSQNRAIQIEPRQLQSKYDKHAKDFGVIGQFNSKNAKQFELSIQSHVSSPKTLVIKGTYKQKQDVIHYLSPSTRLNVMKGMDGKFISGWKLNSSQFENVLTRGSL